MTDTQLEAEYQAALADYMAAAKRLAPLLEARIASWVRATYPEADTLHVLGYTNDEGAFVVRAQRVTASGQLEAGATSASWRAPMGGEGWDDFTDEIDPLLDMLGDLTGDRYEGHRTIATTAARVV